MCSIFTYCTLTHYTRIYAVSWRPFLVPGGLGRVRVVHTGRGTGRLYGSIRKKIEGRARERRSELCPLLYTLICIVDVLL